MVKTIRAKYTKGVIKPLEKLNIKEGKEISITIKSVPGNKPKKNGFAASAGGWKGTIDAEKFLEYIYTRRSVSTPSRVKLG